MISMSELNKIGILLTFLFSFFSLALFAEILYLIIFRHRASTDNHRTGKPTGFLPVFLCRKRQHSCRVEPSAAPPEAAEMDMVGVQNLRLLYTIKEEEREGSVDWSSERFASLGDHRWKTLVVRDSAAAAHDADPESICSDQSTLFATPWASPPYYSPLSSPERETS